jgi:hypothetical protein
MYSKISPERKNLIDVKHWFKRKEISQEYRFFLILAALHNEKKISNELLKGQFSSLRKGDLLKRKNTYNSKISKRWYNFDSMEHIFEDYLYLIKGEIEFETIIGYLNLYLNKNYNYCLNVFAVEFISKLYDAWDPTYCHDTNFYDHIKFYVFGENLFPMKKESYYSCCDYCGCCGCTNKYKKNEILDYKDFSNSIHNRKKGNLNKIPFFDIQKEKHKSKWF